MKKHDGFNPFVTPIWKRWPHEERDFTPWVVSESLGWLSEVLGSPLKVVKTEHPVGPFEADIVLQRDDGELVVVENQLYVLDHDHIGKALTYASILGAKSVVWIVGGVRPTHQQAISNLDAALTGIDLYLVRIHIPVGETNGGYEAAPELVVLWPPASEVG